jgi:CHAD domain-containing protein/CYTH domain-containing protein
VALERLGRALLEDGRRAKERLEHGTDDEALHDFRVSLRRLRSVLRAFRPYLDHEVPRKLRRNIRDLARATNGARDAEVLLDWVKGNQDNLAPTQRAGARWFSKRLRSQRDVGYEASAHAIQQRFPRLDRRVRRQLAAAAHNPWGGTESQPTFAAAIADLIREQLAALDLELDRIVGPTDRPTVHATRIQAKRLRYLLELIAGEFVAAASAVRRLKRLQDALGSLHDVLIGEQKSDAACEDAAAEHARQLSSLAAINGDSKEKRRLRRQNPVNGLLALSELYRGARAEHYEAFEAWRTNDEPELQDDIESVLHDLRVVTPGGVEIERKYLLTALPTGIDDADVAEVEQGWLPGARLQERLRRVDRGGERQYFRTVKLGEGLSRLEVEEEADAELFAYLWPLTESRRVHKRRYYVPDGTLMWEIDEFLDRPLVLAEVELPSTDAEVVIPHWLEEVLDREVTGDPEYVNVNLAQ